MQNQQNDNKIQLNYGVAAWKSNICQRKCTKHRTTRHKEQQNELLCSNQRWGKLITNKRECSFEGGAHLKKRFSGEVLI